MRPTQALLKRSGLRRLPLTTKQGPHNFYKGNRTGSMGRHTKYGGYIVDFNKVRTYVVPDLSDFYVSIEKNEYERLDEILMDVTVDAVRGEADREGEGSLRVDRDTESDGWQRVFEEVEGRWWEGMSIHIASLIQFEFVEREGPSSAEGPAFDSRASARDECHSQRRFC